jgi:tol-pal system protein YbgF
MSLKNIGDLNSGFRHTWLIFLSLVAFLLIGCGGSEEATTEMQKPEGTAKPLGTVEQEKPQEVKPMEDALTNFVGVDTEKVEAPKPAGVSLAQLAQYEKQIEDLRTENTGLKQKAAKLEQENRGINARISEFEAKYTSEKLRADKAEELAKNAVQTPKVVEESPAPVSASTYDDALKAFKSRKYDVASKGFKSIIDGGSNADLTSRSKYWLGETYFAQKKYKEALQLFQEAIKLKNSDKKADAQFMIAQTYERLGSKTKAKEAYEKVVKNYPMSKNVKRAKARWAQL